MTKKFDKLYESILNEQQIDELVGQLPVIKNIVALNFLKYLGLTQPQLNPKHSNNFNRHVETVDERWAKNIQAKLIKDYSYSPEDVLIFLNAIMKMKPSAKIIKITDKDLDKIIETIKTMKLPHLTTFLKKLNTSILSQSKEHLSATDLQKVKR